MWIFRLRLKQTITDFNAYTQSINNNKKQGNDYIQMDLYKTVGLVSCLIVFNTHPNRYGSLKAVNSWAKTLRITLTNGQRPQNGWSGAGIAQSVVCWARCPAWCSSWVRSFSEPPVGGIFPLELTWVLTPFPKNYFGWKYKPRSSLCTHAFHQQILTFMS